VICLYCGKRETKGELDPCEICSGLMERGVILISIANDAPETEPNPERTGGWVVVTEAYLRHIVIDAQAQIEVLHARVAFIPDDSWDLLKLPRGDHFH
jgi:hypothetical protein